MKGKISISRYTSNSGPGINITIEDDLSGTTIVDLDMSIADFGDAVTGHGHVDCEFVLRTKHVGKLREHKTLVIEIENPYRHRTPEEAAVILAPYEVDGWMGHKQDLGNGHRIVKNGKGVQVTFVRYVDPETKEPA